MEKAIIYIAGDPNAYPVEYYDRESGSYQGLLPEMLRQFSENSSYDVRYYQPDKGDQRADLAEAQQIDLITDTGDQETFAHTTGESVLVLDTLQDGQPAVYRVLVTDVAPEGLAEDLQAFVSGVTTEARTGMLVQSAAGVEPVGTKFLSYAAAIIVAVLAALVMTVVLTVRHYRRRIRGMEQDEETDAVTGVGNKEYLERNYGQYINARNKILYRLLYIYVEIDELDRRGGRVMADEYMRYVAATLRERTGDSDILARVSDSGFVLLRLTMDDNDEREWLQPVLQRLRSNPAGNSAEDARFYGIGSYQIRATDQELYSMILDASQCAQSACRSGEEFRTCSDSVIETLAADRQMQRDVRQGLEKGEFLQFIQLYVDGQDGSIVGGEALSRWEHPSQGLLMPSDFLPFMEREHLIPQLDYLCLENACKALEYLHQSEGESRFFLSCNFSLATFSAPDFPQRCREVIERHEFPRENLIFELKEPGSFRRVAQIRQNVHALKELQVSIALDDFGELFSSFMDIQDMPLDIVKIDRQMVSGIGAKRGESVLRSMIQVSLELGLRVMAEGVETDAQADFLRAERCHALQGYRFYRPLPEREAFKLIHRDGAARETASV